MKNLRVAVIPTEIENGIDQGSTVEQILNCPELQLYPLTDYFKAQNDEKIDLLHWSFLIDIETKTDLTGTNINGVHFDSKAINISYIKTVIAEWGGVTSGELELDSSPSLFSVGNQTNVCELVEQFFADSVETIVYHDDVELEYNNYNYDELSEEIIAEICLIMNDYEADCLKTKKRIAD